MGCICCARCDHTELFFGTSRISTILSGALPTPVVLLFVCPPNGVCLALCCCLFGVGRDVFWTNNGEHSKIGRNVFIGAYGLVGGLEGYLLTMAYRYCGDDEGVSAAMRDSASKMLSLFGVIVVNVPNIFIGILLDNGTIECH